MRVRIELKWQDAWIGAFWRKTELEGKKGDLVYGAVSWYTREHLRAQWDLWVCLVPCLPIHISWAK